MVEHTGSLMINRFYISRFPFAEVRPEPRQIQAFLKTGTQDENHPANAAIGEILPQMENNPGIAGGYILRPVEEIRLDTGKQIEAYMKGACYIALFVCTAGNLITELSRKYNEAGAYLEAYITDAIGSMTVEKAMDNIQAQLETAMKNEGMSITNRYSPGYCKWPLTGQRKLFDSMGEIPVAVSLTESCLMLPVKSVSGIIGVGRNLKKRAYACRICKNKNCIYRKIIS
jgi:hypothetical protein